MFWTTYSQGTQDLTDEVPGTGKRRSGPIDYVLAQPNQANAGLDSYLDVRLAMILFRSVYNSEGATYLPKLASLLLDALEKNPHHMEAWDLLITHIKAGSIADDALIARTHNVLRATQLYVWVCGGTGWVHFFVSVPAAAVSGSNVLVLLVLL